MLLEEVNINSQYIHIKTGNIYKIEGYVMYKKKYKWIRCVLYKSMDTGKLYSRKHKDFNKNFELKEKEYPYADA